MIATTGGASAAEPPPSAPVDVVVREAPPPQRFLVLAWNPLPLFTLGKVSGDLVLAPVDHHALVLSPFYASTTTKPVFVFDNGGNATLLPVQKFTGFGGEIGYRYYAGQGGPRGFFLGPSFMAGSFTATAQNGTQTSYLDYGIAADAGYEALVADHVALSAGLGVQYNFTSKSIPNQQFPAEVYANNGVRPRLLLSLGWAF